MLVSMKEQLIEAHKNKKAIYQFNINNLEWIKYILEECNNNQYPVILGVSMSAAKYMCGYKNVYDMVTNLIDNLHITIPVSLHLDHANDIEECKKAIDSGFTSIMLDYSSFPLEENIKMTNELINYINGRYILVEGEIGPIKEGSYADINDCISYVNNTNIDILAASIGNIHGIYQGEVKLNYDLLSEISQKTNKPVVLHGASGINDEMLKKCVSLGVSKININTDLQIAWYNGLRNGIKDNPDVYDPRKVINFGEKNLKECLKDRLSLFK
jgi:ketose-bisphosphate aldolase